MLRGPQHRPVPVSAPAAHRAPHAITPEPVARTGPIAPRGPAHSVPTALPPRPGCGSAARPWRSWRWRSSLSSSTCRSCPRCARSWTITWASTTRTWVSGHRRGAVLGRGCWSRSWRPRALCQGAFELGKKRVGFPHKTGREGQEMLLSGLLPQEGTRRWWEQRCGCPACRQSRGTASTPTLSTYMAS